MMIAAIVFAAIGFFVVFKRSRPEALQQQNQLSQEENGEVAQEPVDLTIPANWQVYNNEKYGFSVQHPSNVKAGSVSDNSVLGTFQVPVRGFHVGPLVFVVLKDAELKQEATNYFEATAQAATSGSTQGGIDGPSVSCKMDKITNTSITVRSVSCVGEGGPARYAYIKGSSYDVFVDGYSKGYGDDDNGNFSSEDDYEKILSTFKFKTTATTTNTTTNTASQTPPAIQKFTIVADDNGASPNEINVPLGTIVQITFNVTSDVYYGGLEFKSSEVNSGVIQASSSKTISFNAEKSFAFTPYWPASGVAKNYRIQVNVQ